MTASGVSWRIFGVALALNLLWEMVQMFAYAERDAFSATSLLTCSGAALADALYVTCVYWIGITIRRTPFWVFEQSALSVIVIALSGFLTAFVLERIALLEGFWHYRKVMPKLPFGVGLWPVLQLMILPILTFWLASPRRLHKGAWERQH